MIVVPALCIALVVSAPAKPKTPPPAPVADDTQKAKEAFQTAQRLYKEARYAEAIVKFEEAYAIKPSPVLFFNIGRCHEQLADVPKAMRAYREYLRMAPDAKDKDTVNDAIANLERRLKEKGLQQLLVFADPPTALIEVDGKVLGNSPASVELTAGNHKLTVKAEGYETTERAFVMQVQRATEMTINLRPAATPPIEVKKDPPKETPKDTTKDVTKKDEPKRADLTPKETGSGTGGDVVKPAEPAPRKRLFTWVAAGTAGAAAVGGIIMYAMANGLAKDIANQPVGTVQRVQGLQTGSFVLFGVAGAAAVSAIVLFFLEGK
jgi:hypothetical protein